MGLREAKEEGNRFGQDKVDKAEQCRTCGGKGQNNHRKPYSLLARRPANMAQFFYGIGDVELDSVHRSFLKKPSQGTLSIVDFAHEARAIESQKTKKQDTTRFCFLHLVSCFFMVRIRTQAVPAHESL